LACIEIYIYIYIYIYIKLHFVSCDHLSTPFQCCLSRHPHPPQSNSLFIFIAKPNAGKHNFSGYNDFRKLNHLAIIELMPGIQITNLEARLTGAFSLQSSMNTKSKQSKFKTLLGFNILRTSFMYNEIHLI